VRPFPTEPDQPESDRPRRRYGLVVVALLVLAVVAFAGYRAWRGTPGPDRDSTDPTFPAVESISPAVDPSGAATPSPSPSTPGPAPTSHRPTPRATPTSSTPAQVTYRVRNDDLCGYIDFTVVNNLTSPPGQPSVSSWRKDYPESGDTLYVCEGYSGRVNVKDIDVVVYPSPSVAAARYAEAKSYAPPGAKRVDGVGTDAYGYVWNSTSYRVVALAGNITFRITLTPRSTPAPGTDQLATAAITIARTTIPKLSR
jgi:hypothetical protein